MGRSTTKLGDYSVNTDWNPRRGESYLYKNVRLKRAKVGEIRKHPDGKIIFWMERKAEELVFIKSEWNISKYIMALLRCTGCTHIGIAVSNGDRWEISYENFEKNRFDLPEKGKFGVSNWFVKLDLWSFTKGAPEDIERAMSIGKWK